LGWTGLVRVDGALYIWLGAPVSLTLNATLNNVTFNSYQVTPTRSILSLTAGKMAINVTFLSPIERDDLVLQSFPFTYIFFEASSMDGNPHSLQVYQDISGEWVSSDDTDAVQWNTTKSGAIIYHQAQHSPPQYLTEKDNLAVDPVVYHVTNAGSNITWQTGQDTVLRSAFLNNGTLANTPDTRFRGINNDWPVFAFSTDLGTIKATSLPVVWGLGLVQNPDISYTSNPGNPTRYPYFATKYSNISTAMSEFMSNASNALQRAEALDDMIVSDANKVSSNYTDLVSLASRQVMAGMEITVGSDLDGNVNASDTLIFMKDTGNSQRINPVEVIFAALPAILYFNASWVGYLLEPLLRYESSGLYTEDFAAEDLGNDFPQATTISNDSPDPSKALESTSDMLIMVWAHATFSGDGSLLSSYVRTFSVWRRKSFFHWLMPIPLSTVGMMYIVNREYVPFFSIPADGLSYANMTNLAIKGIIAIRSMAEISQAVGESDDYNSYSNEASSLASQWQSYAWSSGHLTLTYGNSSSWGLMYNLYPDKLLGFNLVNDDVCFCIL
ncbi:hypothetical protein GYMLUDRAFT_158671, partial [Collybiopsis luxurians FD-317 M1]